MRTTADPVRRWVLALSPKPALALMAMALLASGLASCGGGGGSRSGGTPPSVPTNVQATAGTEQVTIDFDPVAGTTSYNLYWATTPGVNKSNGTQITGVTSPYVHLGVANGVAHYYVVTAVNTTGGFSESSESAEAPVIPLAAPAGLVGIGGDSQIALDWTLVTGASTYNLYWANSSGVSQSSGTAIPGVTPPYTHPLLVNGTDEIEIPGFTLFDSLTGLSIFTESATLSRTGNVFRGIVTVVDGEPLTSWDDYQVFLVELSDPNDTDSDGLPDIVSTPEPAAAAQALVALATVIWLRRHSDRKRARRLRHR